MIKATLNLILLFSIFISCVHQGDENISGKSAPEDITISLLKLNPPSVVLSANESFQFSVVGGNGPYLYEVTTGYGSITQNGIYTASANLGSSTIKATDAGGNTSFAVISVGSSLQISPSSKTLGTDEVFTISAVGGNAPYTFSIVSGLGSIVASTGVFTADSIQGTTTVKVVDINGSVSYSVLTIVDALVMTPTTLLIEDTKTNNFVASGGAPPYTYQVYVGTGSIDSNGLYTAPAVEGTDIIRVVDSNSNYTESTITIKKGPNLTVTDSSTVPGQVVTVSSDEGTAPFVYSIQSGLGAINSSTGVFTSPSIASTTVIRCTDANALYSEITIQTSNLKKIAIGDAFTCGLQVNDDNITSILKCWGTKNSGVDGKGNSFVGDAASEMGDNLPPLDFGTVANPIGVYSSLYYHKCVLFSDNKMKCWGDGASGKLGVANETDFGEYANSMGDKLKFTRLGSGITVGNTLDIDKRIILGGYHTCVSLSTGGMKCFGEADRGRTGNGDLTDYCNGAGNCDDNAPELELNAGESIVQISAGNQHSCAIIAPDNKVKCWGEGDQGRQGDESTADNIAKPKDINFIDLDDPVSVARTAVQIASGHHHTCALLDNQKIKCWGNNSYGQLGIENNTHKGGAPGDMGAGLSIADMGTVSFPVKIFAKGFHSCALFDNDQIKCWGYGGNGRLGRGNGISYGDHSNEMGDNLPFVDVGTGVTVKSVDLSEYTTCVITDSDEVKCWGYNAHGQLGLGHNSSIGDDPDEMGDNLQSVDLGAGRSAVMVAAANFSTCALLDNNTVKCWGDDYQGDLGLASNGYGDDSGETVSSLPSIDLGTNEYAKDIFVGRYHACAILMDDNMKCWGEGANGRLGYENQNDLGDAPNEMGDNLNTVNVGTGLKVVQGAAGENHTCVVLDNDELKCFGYNGFGQLGINNTTQIGDSVGEMGDSLNSAILGAGRTAKQVTAGNSFSCVLMDNNQVKCFGYNAQGQLGLGDIISRGDAVNPTTGYTNLDLGVGRSALQVEAGHLHMCILMDNGKVKCYGYGYFGQLGYEDTTNISDNAGETGAAVLEVDLGFGRTATMISAGIYHTCALLDNNEIRCWGANWEGPLGIGNGSYVGRDLNTMGDQLVSVLLPSGDKPLKIFSGAYSTCAVMESNDVKCWGRNFAGELGHGHNYSVGTDALSMEGNLPVSF